MALIDAHLIKRFNSETADGIDRVERMILDAATAPLDIDRIHAAFRSLHSIKGNAGFFGFQNIEFLAAAAESRLELLRAGRATWRPETARALLVLLDRMRTHLEVLEGREPDELEHDPSLCAADDHDREIAEVLAGAALGLGTDAATDPAAAPKADAGATGDADAAPVTDAAPATDADARPAAAPDDAGDTPSIREELARRDVRVETGRLDDLVSLVGELVTAQSMVLDSGAFTRLADRQLARAASRLRKVSRELQEAAMALRLVPLSGLFQRMRRLARDVAEQTGKQVQMEISGGETEMDKNVVEQIADPLVHIIRNAIDHGIEEPGARTAAGKAPSGMVTLSAEHAGSDVVITVADDGAGLDPDRILSRAVERGLVDPDQQLAREAILALIFEPGFSTAAQVSDISGRGVGMDVVRRNIEAIRGRVEVHSEPGQSSTVTLRIPLTVAIMEGVTGHVGSVRVSFPIEDVQEFIRPRSGDVVRVDGGTEALMLRGRPIPLLRLADVYRAADAESQPEQSTVVVMRVAGESFGAMIDGVDLSHQFMVRPLPDYLLDVRAVSGCTVLSTGEVSMIVDARALLSQEIITHREVLV